jgi:hypothetical protein
MKGDTDRANGRALNAYRGKRIHHGLDCIEAGREHGCTPALHSGKRGGAYTRHLRQLDLGKPGQVPGGFQLVACCEHQLTGRRISNCSWLL